MEAHKLVCISCPIGCRMTIEKDNTSPQGYRVLGSACKRGVTYAIKELTAPTRMVTSTVKINGAFLCRLPVRTDVPIPKDKIFECMALINAIEVNSPVIMGQVLVDNLFETGAKVIASRSL